MYEIILLMNNFVNFDVFFSLGRYCAGKDQDSARVQRTQRHFRRHDPRLLEHVICHSQARVCPHKRTCLEHVTVIISFTLAVIN